MKNKHFCVFFCLSSVSLFLQFRKANKLEPTGSNNEKWKFHVLWCVSEISRHQQTRWSNEEGIQIGQDSVQMLPRCPPSLVAYTQHITSYLPLPTTPCERQDTATAVTRTSSLTWWICWSMSASSGKLAPEGGGCCVAVVADGAPFDDIVSTSLVWPGSTRLYCCLLRRFGGGFTCWRNIPFSKVRERVENDTSKRLDSRRSRAGRKEIGKTQSWRGNEIQKTTTSYVLVHCK